MPACPHCGMDREKFAVSRMVVDYDDGKPVGLCSLHCVAVDLAVAIDKTPTAIWVADMPSKKLVNAETAVWVLGGTKSGRDDLPRQVGLRRQGAPPRPS